MHAAEHPIVHLLHPREMIKASKYGSTHMTKIHMMKDTLVRWLTLA
jgi:hypothetical protein